MRRQESRALMPGFPACAPRGGDRGRRHRRATSNRQPWATGSPDPSLRRVFSDVPEYVADDVDVGLGGHPVVEGEANRSLALPAGRARVDAAIRLKGIEELTVASVVLVVVPRRVGVPGADE